MSVHFDDGRIHEVLGVDLHLLGQRDWCPDEVATGSVSCAEHGFWARFQRTLINTLAINAESSHLARHVDDLAAGHFVVMALASDVGTREEVAETLRAGAKHVGFFGPLAWQALDRPRL